MKRGGFDKRPGPRKNGPGVAKYIVKTPEGGETVFILDQEEIRIGRDPQLNHIVLADPSVSRKHAQIKKEQEGHVIVDLGSVEGVVLNGRRVAKAVLANRDEIRLGQMVIEVFF